MKNGKKFMKGCKMPHPPPFRKILYRMNTSDIESVYSIYISYAYRSYRSNTLAIYIPNMQELYVR